MLNARAGLHLLQLRAPRHLQLQAASGGAAIGPAMRTAAAAVAVADVLQQWRQRRAAPGVQACVHPCHTHRVRLCALLPCSTVPTRAAAPTASSTRKTPRILATLGSTVESAAPNPRGCLGSRGAGPLGCCACCPACSRCSAQRLAHRAACSSPAQQCPVRPCVLQPRRRGCMRRSCRASTARWTRRRRVSSPPPCAAPPAPSQCRAMAGVLQLDQWATARRRMPPALAPLALLQTSITFQRTAPVTSGRCTVSRPSVHELHKSAFGRAGRHQGPPPPGAACCTLLLLRLLAWCYACLAP